LKSLISFTSLLSQIIYIKAILYLSSAYCHTSASRLPAAQSAAAHILAANQPASHHLLAATASRPPFSSHPPPAANLLAASHLVFRPSNFFHLFFNSRPFNGN